MCGIAGYVGDKDSADVLVDALSKLEYRGYDSAGIAVVDHGSIKVKKCKSFRRCLFLYLLLLSWI